jgi:hypothetical protein
MKKKVIYTAVFGGKDELIDPKHVDNSVDYICFSDSKETKLGVFKVVNENPIFFDPRMSARMYKILPHVFLEDYEESIWVDGSVTIKGDLFKLMGNKDDEIVSFKHPERKCLYKEIEAAEISAKITKFDGDKQADYYRSLGMPENFGLWENTVIYRKHNQENIIKLDEEWWEQLRKFTIRDQVSLPYCIWKSGIKIGTINLNVRKNSFTEVKEHKL